MTPTFIQCVEPKEVWYRYVDTQGVDYASDTMRPLIDLEEYRVVKRTNKGVWLGMEPVFRWSRQRFVLNKSHKKYAYPTRAEAWESFKIRKQRQLQHLVRQHDHVVATLRLIEEKEKGPVARCVPALD